MAELIARLKDTIAPYPDGVVELVAPLRGTSFFPGGDGLWKEGGSPEFPQGKIMVLGHDWGTVDYLNSECKHNENLDGPTWRNLRKALLEPCGIALTDCFFTNVYMGARASGKMTGTFPGAKDENFVKWCLDFLDFQIATQRPRLILTLGINVPPLLARLSDDLAEWRSVKSFKDLDALNEKGPLRKNISFPNHKVAAVAALTHPSLWYANVAGRVYDEKQGKMAEITLLKDAVKLAFNLGTASRTPS